MKVAYNRCYGGFSVSKKAVQLMVEYGHPQASKLLEDEGSFGDMYHLDCDEARIHRNDPILIRVIEELGKDANGSCARIEIEDIDDEAHYSISEYDGKESVEVHYLNCHCHPK